MAGAKAVLRDLTPPIIYRFVSKVRSRNLMQSDAGADWYDDSFENADHWRSHYSKSPWYYIWTVIVDRLQAIGSPAVLEIGCGPGQLAAFMRDRNITDYLGFDFSPKRIEWAKSRVTDMRFEIADAYATNLFSAVNYNTVVCTEFLEHVEGDHEVIARIRAGTRFIGTVPSFGGGSHVRFFKDAAAVTERYTAQLAGLRVDTFAMPWEGQFQFLLDGTVREQPADTSGIPPQGDSATRSA